MLTSVFRLIAIAGTIAGAVLLALFADDSIGNASDLGWGLFCVAVGVAAHYLEGGVTIFIKAQ